MAHRDHFHAFPIVPCFRKKLQIMEEIKMKATTAATKSHTLYLKGVFVDFLVAWWQRASLRSLQTKSWRTEMEPRYVHVVLKGASLVRTRLPRQVSFLKRNGVLWTIHSPWRKEVNVPQPRVHLRRCLVTLRLSNLLPCLQLQPPSTSLLENSFLSALVYPVINTYTFIFFLTWLSGFNCGIRIFCCSISALELWLSGLIAP